MKIMFAVRKRNASVGNPNAMPMILSPYFLPLLTPRINPPLSSPAVVRRFALPLQDAFGLKLRRCDVATRPQASAAFGSRDDVAEISRRLYGQGRLCRNRNISSGKDIILRRNYCSHA